MKASETNFQALIEGTKQYAVPLFQRRYSWQRKEWQDLLDDLNDLYENESTNNHFIGSIVTMPQPSEPQSVPPFLLIDGQQRLTTIFVLLILLRDIAKTEEGTGMLAEKIHNTLLTNQYHEGLNRYKLLPTLQDNDRHAFFELINEKIEAHQDSLIVSCYLYFKKGIRLLNLNCEKLYQVIVNRLSIVGIVLESDDNPSIVFESLNARGRPLTEADLIRNYFFMKIDLNQQEMIYKEYWLPMQNALGDDLTEFMRHYLASDGAAVKTNEVYLVLKRKVDLHKNPLAELNRIKRFADFYDKIIKPEKESNLVVRQNLTRLNRLNFTVLHPFLLNCYFDYEEGKLTTNEFVDILKILENFLIRRFVCNIQTRGLNKILPVLHFNAVKQSSNFIDGLQSYLQSQNYPKDNEFKKNLIESSAYGNDDKQAKKTRLILETLENHFNHKEKPSFANVSIEHVMPQTLTKEWETQLGEDWQQDYDFYLNTLGNLTLTAYNSELSNKSFNDKKTYFKNSNFSLNAYFESVEKWDKTAIEKRAECLADKALEIWAYFGSSNQTTSNSNSVAGTKPKSLMILDEVHRIKSWKDVYVTLLDWVADNELETFIELSKEYPHLINQDSFNLRRFVPLKNNYYVEIHLNADQIYRFCNQAMQRIGLSTDDWKIEFE